MLKIMRHIIYFIVFMVCLISTINSLASLSSYYIIEVSNFAFMKLFLIALLSLGGAILFGFAFVEEFKRYKYLRR